MNKERIQALKESKPYFVKNLESRLIYGKLEHVKIGVSKMILTANKSLLQYSESKEKPIYNLSTIRLLMQTILLSDYHELKHEFLLNFNIIQFIEEINKVGSLSLLNQTLRHICDGLNDFSIRERERYYNDIIPYIKIEKYSNRINITLKDSVDTIAMSGILTSFGFIINRILNIIEDSFVKYEYEKLKADLYNGIKWNLVGETLERAKKPINVISNLLANIKKAKIDIEHTTNLLYQIDFERLISEINSLLALNEKIAIGQIGKFTERAIASRNLSKKWQVFFLNLDVKISIKFNFNDTCKYFQSLKQIFYKEPWVAKRILEKYPFIELGEKCSQKTPKALSQLVQQLFKLGINNSQCKDFLEGLGQNKTEELCFYLYSQPRYSESLKYFYGNGL